MREKIKAVNKYMVVLVPFIIAGCVSSSPLLVKLQASSNINRNLHGDPLSVAVRWYQLRNQDAFTNATFNQIWHRDKAILGDSLLATQELIINPGERRQITLSKCEHAKYFAAIAIFRNPNRGNWQAIIPLSTKLPYLAKFKTIININLTGESITMKSHQTIF